MKDRKPAQSFVAITALCAGLAVACPAGLAAKEPPPEGTNEGLHLYKQTKQRIAYVRPGAKSRTNEPHRGAALRIEQDLRRKESREW